ncbi:MAG: aminoacyl-tRNA hydrolase [Phycisphaerae bacterium]|nr:aminoacyl-tRNA hydrolase [Phycisphaerae bacterium]
MVQDWTDLLGRLMDAGSLETKEDASMKLIAGLGNPGKEYEDTRHNVGFMVLDALAERFGTKIRQKKFNALVEEVYADGTKLLLVKPQQYMNRSGHAIATAAGYYKLASTEMLIVTDDMALDVGRIRLRAKGSSGGHKGLKDIMTRLASDNFPRLRVGIGDSGRMDSADYVLSRFSADERAAIDKAVQTAVEAILCWLRDGIDMAMTRYNTKNDADGN